MDYDRNDALLHWIFRQTQGDAWFRPNEEAVSSGVALRVSESGSVPEYRVFPYETPSLLPFLSAITPLAPLVAVKTRSAAVHAALAEVSSSLPASSCQVPVPPSPRLPPSQTPSGTGSPTPSSSAPPPSNPNVSLPTSLYVDSETRIQIVDTMLHLPTADLNQNAAFIRDERVLVVWAESIDRIVPLCNDIEERLIKLLWRSRPMPPSSSLKSSNTGYGYGGTGGAAGHSGSTPGSVSGHGENGTPSSHEGLFINSGGLAQKGSQILRARGAFGELGRDPLEAVAFPPSSDASLSEKGPKHRQTKTVKRTWYGGKRVVDVLPPGAAPPAYGTEDEKTAADVESGEWLEDSVDTAPHKRPVKLLAPIYNGVAAGLALVFVGNGVRTLLMEWRLDGNAIRFALLACAPLLYCVSLFFALQIVQNVGMAIGPIAHFHSNSKYYSALKPRANKVVDERLPHVTIQMPVYKESLEQVLAPSIRSLKKAMQTYARQGGTSNIFINDDGLRLLPPSDRDARLAFYANHNIGWVARPRHDAAPGGFKRAGRFKKASNMNYGLALSLKMEKHLDALIMSADESHRTSQSLSNAHSGEAGTQYGIQYQNRDGDESVIWGAGGRGHMPGTPRNSAFIGAQGTATPTGNNPTGLAHWGDADLEERALSMAIEEAWEEDTSERKVRPWAANGRGCRVGEIVLIVDSDTVVPEDCLRDAAREMAEDPRVAIIQHESDVLKVVGHYFENGIAYFTRRINRCISISCANGEVAPFMGHNAFLRWRAIQDAAFVDPADGQVKIWSESNVSEDFDMALRLMLRGYLIRWATYSEGGFKEGVSLSAEDELNRWQKYAYGCNELLFNPIIEWWRKGPISRQIHRFLWSGAPLHYKISMLSYMFSYYGIAGSITIGLINYVLLGFQFEVDGYFMHAFEIWLATTVVFWGSGTIGYTLLEYRLGRRSLLGGLWENLMWIPFFFFFFGGLAIPLTQAILAHLFSYNMQWAATKKEVERSNFFKEIPKIARRFWFPLLLSFSIIAGIIVLSTRLVPFEWRVTGEGWAVILPLALTCGCHILYPIVLNPWLMVFSY